jgi:hypothetical protein
MRCWDCHPHAMGGVIDIPEVLTERPIDLNGRRLKNMSVRKSFPCPEFLGCPFVPSPWDGRGGGQNRGINPMLQGTLRLLRGGGAEDALQLSVHLTHPIGGGCRQRVQNHGRCGHVLAGLLEGGELLLRPFHCHGLACLKHQFSLARVG